MKLTRLRQSVALLVLLLLVTMVAQVQARPVTEPQRQDLAPTYRIFATRQGLVGRMTANGHIIVERDRFVALPSWAVLSPMGTDRYSVRVTYRGRSVVVPVWDVGPWNTSDEYWDPNRQRYSDLPVGVPMAQAAYYNGYNGGRDEQGRRINNPNGIDIADGTFWDDLQMTNNDWVEVSFLWLGRDPGPGAAVSVTAPVPAPAPTAPPAPTATPAPPVEAEAGALVVDDAALGFVRQGFPWNEAACGFGGSHTWTGSTMVPARATASAFWEPTQLTPGYYELLAYIPACGGTATRSARYEITHDGGTTLVPLDQQAHAGTWASLGAFSFGSDPSSTPRVFLDDLTEDEGLAVRYDALAWAPRNDPRPPTASIQRIEREGTGYRIVWGGSSNPSAIASYDVQVRQMPRGGWNDWQRATTATEAWFGPDEGRHFAFRARARDRDGNLQPWPPEPDLDTTQALAE
ncbi:golvesin C-terminal-like domain-containing protein [Candidatus Viridilinea mediisalina]|uniref:Golvesin/Xly CBD-like domain-containing protein n=1 Tax=Candidatus Viridilinea mediisalina TaxID=2024553 RepID=A0A2A6RDV9_9CHLR|nr:hypothetical protein [Candidatus Viridilinea mediisalina]PDW00167.1 hypothetical protein CJ255_21025 [Candidatus Viridilinea mediisalina]